jgi:glycosyltransferase involved in cell wall biosynthesis
MMKRVAVICESSPFDRKGLFNAVHNRTRCLSAEGTFQIDAYCMHIRDSFLSRRLRKTEKVSRQDVVQIDGVPYKMLWRHFSYMDALRHRLSLPPANLLKYAEGIAARFKDYDVVAAHSYEGGLVAYEINKQFGIPYTVTWHGSDVHTHPLKDKSRAKLTAMIMEHASVNFFVSENLLAISSRITDNAVKAVLYNGVSEEFIRFGEEGKAMFRSKYGLAANDKVVAYVGNFHKVKNVTVLPELFSRIHDHFEMHLRDAGEMDYNLKFWIIGDGKLRKEVEPLIKRFVGTDVTFWGNLPSGDMPVIMNCIDLLVLPSRNEGLPLVTLEALKCGASVIGSEVGGVPEVIGKEFCVPFPDDSKGHPDYESPEFADRMAQKAVKQLFYPEEQNLDPKFSWKRSAQAEVSFLKALGAGDENDMVLPVQG